MTLLEALLLNKRVSILPAPLAAEIRKLDLITIRKIVEDPKEQLIYNKLDLFLEAIRELQPPEIDQDSIDLDHLMQNIKHVKQKKPVDISRIKYSARYKRAMIALQKLPKTG